MSIKQISVIIVIHNNEKTIGSCLVPIFKNTRGALQEVVVVDNASSDASLGIVEKFFSQVSVIRNKKNLGFATANNQAIRKSKEADFILLLNPDTEIVDDAIGEMVAYMKNHVDIGILGPKLLYFDGKIQKELTPFPTLVSEILTLLRLHRAPLLKKIVYPKYDYEKTQEVEHLMGSALLVRKVVFDKIGFFDENFFLWFEETDFEKRVKDAGFKLAYYPKAIVKHFVGHSTKQINPIKRQAIWNQSLRYYFKKHRPLWEQILIRPFMYVSYIPAFLLSFKKEYSKH